MQNTLTLPLSHRLSETLTLFLSFSHTHTHTHAQTHTHSLSLFHSQTLKRHFFVKKNTSIAPALFLAYFLEAIFTNVTHSLFFWHLIYFSRFFKNPIKWRHVVPCLTQTVSVQPILQSCQVMPDSFQNKLTNPSTVFCSPHNLRNCFFSSNNLHNRYF